MAKDNAYKTIAEVYRNREHSLIQKLQTILDRQIADTPDKTTVLVSMMLHDHLSKTGRDPSKAVEVPAIINVEGDARTELLALVGPSVAEVAASYGRTKTSTRKVRSDKGKKRGSYKDKVNA